jgi:hypothetical protein
MTARHVLFRTICVVPSIVTWLRAPAICKLSAQRSLFVKVSPILASRRAILVTALVMVVVRRYNGP